MCMCICHFLRDSTARKYIEFPDTLYLGEPAEVPSLVITLHLCIANSHIYGCTQLLNCLLPNEPCELSSVKPNPPYDNYHPHRLTSPPSIFVTQISSPPFLMKELSTCNLICAHNTLKRGCHLTTHPLPLHSWC